MRSRHTAIALILTICAAQDAAADDEPALEEVLVTARAILSPELGAVTVSSAGIASKRARTSDTASLLEGIPGVSVRNAGGCQACLSSGGWRTTACARWWTAWTWSRRVRTT